MSFIIHPYFFLKNDSYIHKTYIFENMAYNFLDSALRIVAVILNQ